MLIWRFLPTHSWDAGKVMSVSLRQGIFLGFSAVLIVAFYLLGLLNWWIGPLIFGVFLLVELALEQ
jgi:hypothetical protein